MSDNMSDKTAEKSLKKEISKKVTELTIEREEVVYQKRSLENILSDIKKIDQDKVATETLTWLIKNVENYISNNTKVFKLDLILDNEAEEVKDMEEIKKLQDLFRSVPDDTVQDDTVQDDAVNSKTKEDPATKARKELNKVTEKIFKKINGKKDLLKSLFERMSFYYELKGITKGKMLLQKLIGEVTIRKFDYETFSVGVKVRDPKANNVVKEYVIPEGFTVCVEIVFTPVSIPTSMF